MRVHHLNCGSLVEVDAVDAGAESARVVCHVLLIETDASGLVLVDTGLGTGDISDPAGRLGRDWVTFAGPVLDESETAVRQVESLGFAAADVRHIVLTHLHNDHVGGLSDFPEAAVHLRAAELAAADPGSAQLAHGPKWATYGDGGDAWLGFDGVRPLDGVGEEIALVPLGGHTAGHAAVAVRDGGGWLLHAGDAYFHHGEVDRAEPVVHPVMELVQEGGEVDRELRLRNVALLREAARDIEVFCAHDPWEFARYR